MKHTRKSRRMEVFYTDPCASPPVYAREKGNVDRKTLVGAALARCICRDILEDEWRLTYERGKYGRGIRPEFEKVLIKIQHLYHGFEKEIIIRINNVVSCDSRTFSNFVKFNDPNLFDETKFKLKRERLNELSSLFKGWSKTDSDMRMDISIAQLGIVLDGAIKGSFGVHAFELMRYKSGFGEVGVWRGFVAMGLL